MLSIAKAIRAILGFALFSVLVPIAVDWFKKANPTAADYGTTFGRAMSAVAAITELPWFYPAVFVLLGLTIGAWVDWVSRRMDGTRKSKRRRIGDDLIRLAAAVLDRQNGFHGEWPLNTHSLRPRIMAAFIELRPLKIWFPKSSIFSMSAPDGPNILINYLRTIGTLLSHGHFAEAKEQAQNAKSVIEEV